MTAAVAAVSRALVESWARRPAMVAWIRGGSSLDAPSRRPSRSPRPAPARIGLHHEERVPFGLAIEPGRRLDVEIVVRDLRGQLRGLGRVERREADLGQPGRLLEVPEQHGQGLLGLASSSERTVPSTSPRASGSKRGEEVQPLQRLLIAPLEVVDQEEKRLGRLEDGPSQGLEEPQPIPELGHGSGPGKIAALGEDLRHHARQLDQPHVLEARDVRSEAPGSAAIR